MRRIVDTLVRKCTEGAFGPGWVERVARKGIRRDDVS